MIKHNAALSGEQRRPPHLNHCAVNTKAESNRKCRALGIRLKRLVIGLFAPLHCARYTTNYILTSLAR
ncbi:hypothetical protein FHO69_21485 [Vibrio vulnificus]|nr:hypothetical protein [Vibrio vulnificus]